MVKIRLARRGRKKLALYDVVVADARSPRDGRFIEKIGRYNPNTDPATVEINTDRAFYWVMNGAQPTDTVRAMLSYKGIMLRKHLQVGVNKGAITQEEADKRLADWLEQKTAQIKSKEDKLSQEQQDAKKARLAAESKVKEARAEAIKKREEEAQAAEQEATAESSEEGESQEVAEEATEEAAAETEGTEEAEETKE
ncbi:MAG: 30S ribosomal protein S16 [Bacteroidota bacterium]